MRKVPGGEQSSPSGERVRGQEPPAGPWPLAAGIRDPTLAEQDHRSLQHPRSWVGLAPPSSPQQLSLLFLPSALHLSMWATRFSTRDLRRRVRN